MKVKVLVAQSCPTPWIVACQTPLSMAFSKARRLEWVVIFSSRGSSRPRDLNPGLLHCKWILYHLSHSWKPTKLAKELAILLDWISIIHNYISVPFQDAVYNAYGQKVQHKISGIFHLLKTRPLHFSVCSYSLAPLVQNTRTLSPDPWHWRSNAGRPHSTVLFPPSLCSRMK